jgi:hypothetical protein
MTKRSLQRYKWARKLAIFCAAAPLFQLAQCDTFTRQVFANVGNALPATVFSNFQSIALIPLQLIFGGYLFA